MAFAAGAVDFGPWENQFVIGCGFDHLGIDGLPDKENVPGVFPQVLNLLINGTIGAIPIIGDLFSVWFRSHARNANLLRQAASQPYRRTEQDWLYVAGIIGGYGHTSAAHHCAGPVDRREALGHNRTRRRVGRKL